MRFTAGDSPQISTEGDSTPRHAARANETYLTVPEIRAYVDDWNVESQLRQHTPQSVHSRQARIGKFFWFLEHKGIDRVGIAELRAFFLYCANGHLEPGGRWGNPDLTTPLRPISIHGYHRILKAFYNYLVAEEILDSNPVKRIKPPAARPEIKQPVVDEHLQKIIRACKYSRDPLRDTAIVLVLVDSGLRAGELCGLTMGDWEAQSQCFRVLGKGRKYRSVFLSATATKGLTRYLRKQNRRPETPLFLSKKGKALTPSGLFQMMERLSQRAGIPNTGVHSLRRSFACGMLKAGANVLTIQTLMGHSDLATTRKYIKVTEADCREQQLKFSVADRLSRK